MSNEKTLTPEQIRERIAKRDARFLKIRRGELIPTVTRRADRGDLAFSIDFELKPITKDETSQKP